MSEDEKTKYMLMGREAERKEIATTLYMESLKSEGYRKSLLLEMRALILLRDAILKDGAERNASKKK